MLVSERITHDMTQSLKQKDMFRVQTLRLLIAAIQNADIEKHATCVKAGKAPEPLSDEEVRSIVAREVKKRTEAALEYEKGNRNDLANQERKEVDVLRAYLPEQMSEKEVQTIVERICASLAVEDKVQWGKVMQALSKELKGKADMQQVITLAKSFLGMA